MGVVQLKNRHSPAAALAVFLIVFNLIWMIRATMFIGIDESISTPLFRLAYSALLKFILRVIPAMVFVRRTKNRSPLTYLEITQSPNLRSWMACLGLTFMFLITVSAIELTIGRKSISVMQFHSMTFIHIILQFILPPLFEEILFRGFVLKELLTLFPRSLAIVISSILFVVVHLPYWITHGGVSHALIAKAFGVFVFSLVASWIYTVSRSVWPPTVAHIANNVLTASLIETSG